ncbi:MAG: RecQ family ATP-dependent DNA helicase, partial [Paludibacter sp.]
MQQYLSILKQYWGYDQFRPLQSDIIQSIASGKDTLGLMPTGGGKSLTFQVPAMAMEGLCLVVTPLIALMKDQVENLKKRGIAAAAIYSGMSQNDIMLTLDNSVFGAYKFLYVSPERLATPIFMQKIKQATVCIIAVDESHCISQWGYDFRPSYLRIADIREILPDVPVLALTATATPEVVEDIQKQLHFRGKNLFQKSFHRSNLAYVVRTVENKDENLLKILNSV